MLYFKCKNETTGKIEYDSESRRNFDLLRDCFKAENTAAMFAKTSYHMLPFIYAVTPMGQFAIGMADSLIKKCSELGIKYDVDQRLLDAVHPSFGIDDIISVPNEEYSYRDYQFELIERLCENGRGVIVSPTRSGKSLVIAGLIHNVFQNVYTTKCQNVLILVPNVQLVWQFYDDLNEYRSWRHLSYSDVHCKDDG